MIDSPARDRSNALTIVPPNDSVVAWLSAGQVQEQEG